MLWLNGFFPSWFFSLHLRIFWGVAKVDVLVLVEDIDLKHKLESFLK